MYKIYVYYDVHYYLKDNYTLFRREKVLPLLWPAKFIIMLLEMSIGVFFVVIPVYSIFSSPETGLKVSFIATLREPGYPPSCSVEDVENITASSEIVVSQLIL